MPVSSMPITIKIDAEEAMKAVSGAMDDLAKKHSQEKARLYGECAKKLDAERERLLNFARRDKAGALKSLRGQHAVTVAALKARHEAEVSKLLSEPTFIGREESARRDGYAKGRAHALRDFDSLKGSQLAEAERKGYQDGYFAGQAKKDREFVTLRDSWLAEGKRTGREAGYVDGFNAGIVQGFENGHNRATIEFSDQRDERYTEAYENGKKAMMNDAIEGVRRARDSAPSGSLERATATAVFNVLLSIRDVVVKAES